MMNLFNDTGSSSTYNNLMQCLNNITVSMILGSTGVASDLVSQPAGGPI